MIDPTEKEAADLSSIEPAEPVNPAEPIAPVEPVNPTDPAEPIAPVEPVNPAAPVPATSKNEKQGFKQPVLTAIAAALLVLVVVLGISGITKLIDYISATAAASESAVRTTSSSSSGGGSSSDSKPEEYGILVAVQGEGESEDGAPEQSVQTAPPAHPGPTSQGEGDYARAKMTLNFAFFSDTKSTYLAIDGKMLEDTLDWQIKDLALNLDQSVGIIACPQEGVFVVSASGLNKVADNAVLVEISPDGSRGMYVYYDGIYVFDTADPTVLTRINDFYSVTEAHFSPDGNTLIYNVQNAERDPNDPNNTDSFIISYDLKVYTGAETRTIEDAYGISTSNNGEYIYYVRPSEGALHVTNASTGADKMVGTFRVKPNGIPYDYPVVNSAGTEMIYPTTEGISYIEKDGEPLAISGASTYQIRMIKPPDSPYYDSFFEEAFFYESYVEGSSTLKDKVYAIGGELIYLDAHAQTTYFTERCSYAQLSHGGETLYYLADGILYRTFAGTNGVQELVADDVRHFVVSADEQDIYTVNTEQELTYINAAGKSEVIARDCMVDEAYDLVMLANNRLYFAVNPDPNDYYHAGFSLLDLYCTQSGSQPEMIAFGVVNMTNNGQGLGKSLQFHMGYTYGNDAAYFIHSGYGAPTMLYDSKHTLPFYAQGIVEATEAGPESTAVPTVEMGDYTPVSTSVNISYSTADDRTYFAVNGKVLEQSITGQVHEIARSADQSRSVLTSSREGVFILSADGLVNVSEDGNFAAISPDGSKVMYTDDEGVHLLSTDAGGAPVKIEDSRNIKNAHFSPDGNTLVYSYSTRNSFMVWRGEIISTIEDANAISTSNNGERIFFYRPSEDALYVTNANTGNMVKIAEIGDGVGSIQRENVIVNSDCTEIIYCAAKATYYLDGDGQTHKIADVSSYSLSMVTPARTLAHQDFAVTLSAAWCPEGSGSLKGKVYRLDSGLFYLDENAESIVIPDAYAGGELSSDGNTLYYIKGASLYRASLGSEIAPEKLADSVKSFVVSDDQQHIYYVDTDDDLQYLGANGEIKEVDDLYQDGAVLLANNKLYYLAYAHSDAYDGQLDDYASHELYCSQNGEPGVLVAYGVASLNEFGFFSSMNAEFSLGSEVRDVYIITAESAAPVKLYGQ